MNPSPNSPGSSRHGKRPMIPPFSSSSSESSSSTSPERSRYAAASAAASEEAECYVCGRRFATWKALFGHMRCHPEREWRGVRPVAEGEESSRGRRKWRRRTGEETSAAGAGEYACSECARVFGTRQALGGHRASHRGVMGCSAKAKEATTTTAPAAMEAVAEVRGGRTFVCHVCGRQFATYHGMRIHQRVHRCRHGEAAEGGREERGFMVDLNLPPPPEGEEEEEEEAGNQQGK